MCRLLERFPNAAVLVGAYTIGKERIFKVFFTILKLNLFIPFRNRIRSRNFWLNGTGTGCIPFPVPEQDQKYAFEIRYLRSGMRKNPSRIQGKKGAGSRIRTPNTNKDGFNSSSFVAGSLWLYCDWTSRQLLADWIARSGPNRLDSELGQHYRNDGQPTWKQLAWF